MGHNNIELWFEAGMRHLDQHVDDLAIDDFRRVLSEDPDHVEAHAFLAVALVRTKRLHAADIEASKALIADSESSAAHMAKALVLHARLQWREAKEHLDAAIQAAPNRADVRVVAAEMHHAMREDDVAKRYANDALALEAELASAEVVLGQIARHARDFSAARAHAQRALEVEPHDIHALLLRGWLYLDEGNVAEARQHAVWALAEAPNHESALALIVAIKTRESFILGLWWRFNTAVMLGSRARSIAILLGLYVLKSLAALLSQDFGYAIFADFLNVLWFAFCALTWVGPAMFRRALDKELDRVELRDDF